MELSLNSGSGKKVSGQPKAYVGWTGMPSAVVGVAQQVRAAGGIGDRVEMDPQFAAMLGPGFVEGCQVRGPTARFESV